MDIKINYTPNKWQKKFHASGTTHRCNVGGLGCIRESSLVLTSRGEIHVGDIQERSLYASWNGTGFQLSPGTYAFPKGKENLYRVVHEQGEFVAAGHHLVFSDDREYRRVDDLSKGARLSHVRAFSSQILTSSVLSRTASSEDVLRLKRIVLSFLDHCEERIRLYGQQLLWEVDNAQGFSLEQNDVREFSQPFFGGDGLLVPDKIHSHRGPIYVLPSKTDLLLRVVALVGALESYISAELFERILRDSQESRQSLSSLSFHLKALLSSKLEDSFGQTLTKSSVLSIEKLPFAEWYWDLQVGDTNNYIVDGVIHHNSGKSVAAVIEMIASCVEQPGSLWLVGRKTLPSLKDTILRTVMQWMPVELIQDFNKAFLTMKLINGSEIIFRPLDDPEKFKSLEIAGFIIEEANEVEKIIYDTLKTRLRQRLNGNSFKYKSIIMLNPTEEDQWIPQLFLFEKPKGHELFISTTYDNIENIPEGYIEELKTTFSEEMQKRMLFGQFAKVHTGRPVYPQFKNGNYVSSLEHDTSLPVYRGWDFGYNRPACVWGQFKDGQLRVLAEKQGKSIYLEQFIAFCRQYEDEFLRRKFDLKGREIPIQFIDYCDPRGADESDKGKTSITIMNENGIYPVYRRTFIEEGVKAVRNFMDTKNGEGHPNFQVHPRCTLLIEGYRGGYHREDGEDYPVKDGTYDHIQDAARYMAVFLATRQKMIRLNKSIQENTRVHIHPITGRRVEL